MNNPLIGPWLLENTHFSKDAGKVFSTFACCGGSTMGYKLSGFDVIGMNEIDPRIAEIYKANHNPKYSFICSIRDMIDMDLPEELYDLDILDGSPPCSSFSTQGARDRLWSKKKKFIEGQAVQRLDDLFFSFIELAERLKPKIIVAENVKGLITGKAKGYVKEIVKNFQSIGYRTQIFLLNGANMGLPQARERVFFICRREDLNLDPIKLNFKEPHITVRTAFKWIENYPSMSESLKLPPSIEKLYYKVKQGKSFNSVHPTGSYFSVVKHPLDRPANTLTANHSNSIHPIKARTLNSAEFAILSSFPMDYNYLNNDGKKAKWAMGMSVPPFMMNRISTEIKKQWGHVFNG